MSYSNSLFIRSLGAANLCETENFHQKFVSNNGFGTPYICASNMNIRGPPVSFQNIKFTVINFIWIDIGVKSILSPYIA